MSEEINCINCSIADFKNELCDCNNGFCKEFKSIGTQEDFMNAVMQRIRPQGEWIYQFRDSENEEYKCSECDYPTAVKHNYCPNCGAKMK